MKHNIYKIPKVHPFIKTLEKVKELHDNLDEHIEIRSQLWGMANRAMLIITPPKSIMSVKRYLLMPPRLCLAQSTKMP